MITPEQPNRFFRQVDELFGLLDKRLECIGESGPLTSHQRTTLLP